MSSASKAKKTNTKSDQTPAGQRPGRFGPATWVALLIGAAALAAQAWHGPNEPAANAGRIAFEADGHGKMRRVHAFGSSDGSAIPMPSRPLWKPEVGWLLERNLALSTTQRQAIIALDHEWRSEKVRLETALQDAAGGASNALKDREKEHAVSLPLLKQGLGEYSALSRQYDARRADYWYRATSVLGKDQRAKIDRLSAQSPIIPSGRAL